MATRRSPSDFVRRDVDLLEEHPEAWIVGGPIVHAGNNRLGQAMAIAMSHRLGVGMATHRFPNFEGYVERAQFPPFAAGSSIGWASSTSSWFATRTTN